MARLFFHLTTLLFFFHLYADGSLSPGFFMQVEMLYWQAEEGGLSDVVESSSAGGLTGPAEVKNLEFEWDVGFNIGFGYRLPHDRWDLLLQWTSFQTHADAQKSAQGDQIFFPLWLPPGARDPLFATWAKTHWRLHLGLVDLFLSRPFEATQTLTVTPQCGIRWGSARQKFNPQYRGGNLPGGGEVVFSMKNKFWGIGPYAGLRCDYRLVKDLSLFAGGAFSLLYGEFYLHQSEKEEKRLGIHSIYGASSAILEGRIGLRWHYFFKGCLKRFNVELAWDQLLLFSQNQLLRFVSNVDPGIVVANQGDLSIAGGRFHMGFDF